MPQWFYNSQFIYSCWETTWADWVQVHHEDDWKSVKKSGQCTIVHNRTKTVFLVCVETHQSEKISYWQVNAHYNNSYRGIQVLAPQRKHLFSVAASNTSLLCFMITLRDMDNDGSTVSFELSCVLLTLLSHHRHTSLLPHLLMSSLIPSSLSRNAGSILMRGCIKPDALMTRRTQRSVWVLTK